jgi:hypothetical protein
MNVKKVSLALSFVLIIILIGVTAVDIGSDNSPNENTEPDNPVQNNPDNTGTISILPTGLTEQNGNLTVNEKSLLITHRNQLTNRSVTVNVDKATETGERTVKRTNSSVLVDTSSIGSESTRYSEGDYTITSNQIPASTEESDGKLSVEIGGINPTQYTLQTRLNTLMSNMEVSDYELMEESVRVRFTTNSSNDIQLAYNLNSIDSARMTAVIHQDGYISNASIRVEGNGFAGSIVVREQDYNVTNIDETTIEKPSWVGIAEGSNPLVKGTLSRGSNQIVLEHQGLATVTTEDTEIRILELPSFQRENIELKRQFSEGDLIYLRTTKDGWDISYNQQPADGSRNINNSVTVTMMNTQEQRSKFDITFEQ